MLRRLCICAMLFMAAFVIFGCGNTGKPTTGVTPWKIIKLPKSEFFGGYAELSAGELYGEIDIQPQAGQPFLLDEFVIFYDDRNLGLDNPECGLVDESNKEYWFDQAYQSTEESDGNHFNEKIVNLYSCVVTAPSAGQYRFAVRYDTNDRWYVGPDKIISNNPFTVLP